MMDGESGERWIGMEWVDVKVGGGRECCRKGWCRRRWGGNLGMGVMLSHLCRRVC